MTYNAHIGIIHIMIKQRLIRINQSNEDKVMTTFVAIVIAISVTLIAINKLAELIMLAFAGSLKKITNEKGLIAPKLTLLVAVLSIAVVLLTNPVIRNLGLELTVFEHLALFFGSNAIAVTAIAIITYNAIKAVKA